MHSRYLHVVRWITIFSAGVAWFNTTLQRPARTSILFPELPFCVMYCSESSWCAVPAPPVRNETIPTQTLIHYFFFWKPTCLTTISISASYDLPYCAYPASICYSSGLYGIFRSSTLRYELNKCISRELTVVSKQ